MFRLTLACASLAIAACAATSPPTPTPTSAANQTQKFPCAPEATRLPQKNCGPGQTYDLQDVNKTGQPEASSALRMLDPAITTNH